MTPLRLLLVELLVAAIIAGVIRLDRFLDYRYRLSTRWGAQ